MKIFEIKAKNTADHVTRLEDKENEMKQEYKRLHDRYYEVRRFFSDSIDFILICFSLSFGKLIMIIWRERRFSMEQIESINFQQIRIKVTIQQYHDLELQLNFHYRTMIKTNPNIQIIDRYYPMDSSLMN